MADSPIVETPQLKLTDNGMAVGQTMVTYDEWLEFGNKLWRIRKAVQWAIGDWINYGEAHYGEKYAQAEDITEVSYGTLRNYAWLSQTFDLSRRRDNLSWSHHSAVASIADSSEQDALLDIAESQQMGRDELRDIVKRYKAGVIEIDSSAPLQFADVVMPVFRVIEGRVRNDVLSRCGGQMIFISDNSEVIKEGTHKATLHLYEESE